MPRVMVVEDSTVIREALVEIIEQDPQNQVVAVAKHGQEAIQLAAERRPDVATMDVLLPGMNGLEATRAIMQKSPCPIIVITSQANNEELETAFKSFTAGALSILEKPQDLMSAAADEFTSTLLSQIKHLGNRKIQVKLSGLFSPIRRLDTQQEPPAGDRRRHDMVGITAGLGGPLCLARLLLMLPLKFPMPIVVTQVMPRGFTAGFCGWLASNTGFPVVVVRERLKPLLGSVYFAADGHHVEVHRDGSLGIAPLNPGVLPADQMFESMAESLGPKAVGVALSSTGLDGAEGLRIVHSRGGLTIAQDEHTSLANEVSEQALKLGAVTGLLPMGRLGVRLAEAAWEQAD